MPDRILRFGACEVDLAARGVRLDGRPRPIEPRAFTLLAYLAERSDRIVTKKELLDAVWPGQAVSPAALAQAVMKARQAIGDVGAAALIRNVPRIGYRLVVPSVGKPDIASPRLPDGQQRIAVLPFDNSTGDPTLDWVCVGLMSLVTHSIGQGRRLATVVSSTLLAAVEGAHKTGADPIEAVRLATGAHLIVHGRVGRSGSAYELTFECVDVGGSKVVAESPGELGQLAARAVEAMLFRDAGPEASSSPAGADPLATTAFARALQASARQNDRLAANLLRMTLALQPESPTVQLELLRALAGFGDTENGEPLARSLLAHAEQSGDILLAARVHLALGRAYMFHVSFVRAAFQVEQGVRLLGDGAPPNDQAYAQLLRAEIGAFTHDYSIVEDALERMRQACERGGDRVLPLSRLRMLAYVAQVQGDLERSADLYAQVAFQSRELHALRNQVAGGCNAAVNLAWLGRWNEAAAYAEEAFAAATLLNARGSICIAAVQGTKAYLITDVPAAAQRMVSALPTAGPLSLLERQWCAHARANHAMVAGDHREAARLYIQSLGRTQEGGDAVSELEIVPWLLHALVRSSQPERAEAELAAALRRPAWPDTPATQRQLLHCRAALAHAQGQSERALQHLLDLVDSSAAPTWRAWAALDAAWLQAEAGRCAEAFVLLQRLPTEFVSQPLASAVAARVSFAAGDGIAALRLHQRYLEAMRHGVARRYLVDIGSCYTRAGAAMPPVPFLPSRL